MTLEEVTVVDESRAYLRCLVCGAARNLADGEPIETTMEWFTEHERGQIVSPGYEDVMSGRTRWKP